MKLAVMNGSSSIYGSQLNGTSTISGSQLNGTSTISGSQLNGSTSRILTTQLNGADLNDLQMLNLALQYGIPLNGKAERQARRKKRRENRARKRAERKANKSGKKLARADRKKDRRASRSGFWSKVGDAVLNVSKSGILNPDDEAILRDAGIDATATEIMNNQAGVMDFINQRAADDRDDEGEGIMDWIKENPVVAGAAGLALAGGVYYLATQ